MCGCGSKGLQKPLPKAGQRVHVTVPWAAGATIPRKYTCDGANVAPAVRTSTVAGARDRVIVMTDLDAPGGTFVHWTAWGGGREGRNSFGKTGYRGPCPPKGDKRHRYVISVYALRSRLGLATGSPPERVLAAVGKLALASGAVTGLYGR